MTRGLSPGLSGWGLGLTEALPSLQALCAAVAGPNLLKNMTQLLCVETSDGEEPWSPSAFGGSFPGLLSPGDPHECLLCLPPTVLSPSLCLGSSRGLQLPLTKSISMVQPGYFPNFQILWGLFSDVMK